MILNMPSALMVLIAACMAAGSAFAQRSDAAREQRWAEQIVPTLVVGEPAWLSAPGTARFLALFAQAPNPKAAVLLTHGPGWHPDHGITGELRMHLVDRGYTTLSLQMPVLRPEAEAGPAYRELFPEAAQRIDAGIRFLQSKGHRRIAIVSHAMGSGMAHEYLRGPRAAAPLFAWVAMSYYGDFDDALAGATFPVFDVFGAEDYRGIRWPARGRAGVLRSVPGSKQLAVEGGGWFLAGGEATLRREVPAFLDAALAR
jgi:hypothetical protein